MWRLAGRSAGKARRLVSVLKGEVFTSHYELFKCRVAVWCCCCLPSPSAPIPGSFFFFFFHSFCLSFVSYFLLPLCLTLLPGTHTHTHKDMQHNLHSYCLIQLWSLNHLQLYWGFHSRSSAQCLLKTDNTYKYELVCREKAAVFIFKGGACVSTFPAPLKGTIAHKTPISPQRDSLCRALLDQAFPTTG